MEEERTGRKVQDGHYVCPRHPPHSINSNIHAQTMHENPFTLQARREDDTDEE